MRCNICGCAVFLDMPKRPAVRCAGCGSLERTRLTALHLARLAPRRGSRILHFAPERGLSRLLIDIGGPNYRALDIDPARYPDLNVEPFDLCKDVFGLETGAYDLIIHNHVLEHIECNYSAVLLRLTQALQPAGTMLFSMPILPGPFQDKLMNGSLSEKRTEFGDMLHVRCFGSDFIQQTIGMLFRIPLGYDLTRMFTEAELADCNIPSHHWRAYTGASIFQVSKADVRV